jgi:hypothetical protein
MGLLHTGRNYADALEADGLLCYYPVTNDPGKDDDRRGDEGRRDGGSKSSDAPDGPGAHALGGHQAGHEPGAGDTHAGTPNQMPGPAVAVVGKRPARLERSTGEPVPQPPGHLVVGPDVAALGGEPHPPAAAMTVTASHRWTSRHGPSSNTGNTPVTTRFWLGTGGPPPVSEPGGVHARPGPLRSYPPCVHPV